MNFTLNEFETTVAVAPPFFQPRPLPCPQLPSDLEENWIVDRMPVGVRVVFVKKDGKVHAYHDKTCIDSWEFCKMCCEYIEANLENDIMIDGILVPDGGVLDVVQGDRLGKFYAFDYVSFLAPDLPLAYRKKDLVGKLGAMPETEVVPGDDIKSPADLDEIFWMYRDFGDVGVVIKRKDSTYVLDDQQKQQIDTWQCIP